MVDIREDLIQQRLTKIERLEELGIETYPAHFHRTHSTAQAALTFLDWETQVQPGVEPPRVTVAGRISARRGMGRTTFMDLRDGTGRIQVQFRQDLLGERYALLREFDLGDFLGVSGPLFRTSTGEVTVQAADYTLLCKALRPPPEKWHGLVDVEARYRQRYLDLMANEEVRRTFILRSRIVAAIRQFMTGRGFLEVETPILQPHAGGALARPFTTHYNALDQDFYLRIATELHLKRLLVGGLDKVYEIGRIFRNEGFSTKHNPEYTSMESYEAYADYNDVMAMTEELVAYVAEAALGTQTITYRGHAITLAPPWRRISLREAIHKETGIDFEAYPDADSLRRAMEAEGMQPDPHAGRGKLVDDLLSAYVEPKLIQPTFLLDYPVELSPLAKRHPEHPGLVERFEGFIGGFEIANAFTELNDPRDQRARFVEQVRLREAGDEEAELPDEDFLTAVEYGMPPAGGLGVGIDRLVMIVSDQPSIREVILFPQLRRKE
ncbi:MAG: lysine--tRNA ligase [Chloroflexi bacterium]|nr:lysine--tRNA ligase [Chloroflexota bacterium]